MVNSIRFLLYGGLLGILLIGCTNSATVDLGMVQTAIAQTADANPTASNTPIPTATLEPTLTATPTDTPEPTATATPTETPSPTPDLRVIDVDPRGFNAQS